MMKDSHKACFKALKFLPAALLVIPLFVNVLFAIEAPCDILRARFSAGDLLGYLGSALVGVGSIALAMYAILQTDRIDKVEQEMRERQDQFERDNTKRPFFVVDSVLIDGASVKANENGCYLADRVSDDSVISVVLKNIGDGPACRFRMREDSAFGKPPAIEEHRLCVSAGDPFELNFSIREMEKARSTVMTFRYENVIGCLYSQRIDVRVIPVPIYSSMREEVDDGLFADVMLDETRRLVVSSLTPQCVEERE